VRLARPHRDEDGAVVVLLAILLVVVFGMLVLTVDLGGMVARKRGMVRAADASALAVAQACSVKGQADSMAEAEAVADLIAGENGTALNLDAQNIVALSGCGVGSGTVTVRYTARQELFFAPAVGLGNEASVAADATAAWGSAGPVPLTISLGWFDDHSSCQLPLDPGEECFVVFDNHHNDNTSATWGWMNLEGWYPTSAYPETPDDNCSGPGTSELADQITLQAPLSQLSYGTPAWVCTRTGNTSAWTSLDEIEGQVRVFPISDPDRLDGADPRNWRYIAYFQPATVVKAFDGNDPDRDPTCGPLAAPRNNQTCVHLRGEDEAVVGIHLIRLVD
jgi:Flp pilus assembly protein TadG